MPLQPQPIMNIHFHQEKDRAIEPSIPVHVGTIHPILLHPGAKQTSISDIASYISVSGCHPNTLFAFLPDTKPPRDTNFIECLCGARIRSKNEWFRHLRKMHKYYMGNTQIGMACYSYYAPSGYYTQNTPSGRYSDVIFGFRRTFPHTDNVSKSLLVPLSISATSAGKIIHQAGTCTITGTDISELWDAYESHNCLFHMDKRWRITYMSKLII